MHKLETHITKLPKNLKQLWMEHIDTFELDNWEKVYLLKQDIKYFMLDKKWRNKFLTQDWIHEDNEGMSFRVKKDIDSTNYLVVELSWVTLYYSENWEKYKPKDNIYNIKKSLLNILSWFIDKLWLHYVFNKNLTKLPNLQKYNNKIDHKNYKK